jgi:hypothetical protein
MKTNVLITKGRFVDQATADQIRNLATNAKCSPAEIVAACDVLANPARALSAVLNVAESRASAIISVINAQGAKLSGMKSRIAQAAPVGRR